MIFIHIDLILIELLLSLLNPGERNGNPLQYSCLENPMDGGAWQAAVHGVAKSRTWLSDFTFTFFTVKQYSIDQKYHLFIFPSSLCKYLGYFLFPQFY